MHLAATSTLINRGTNVGLPFNGAAPDLGCFETGVGVPVQDVAATLQSVTVFPNPTLEQLNIRFYAARALPLTVKVFNSLSQEVLTTIFSQNTEGVQEKTLSLHNLPNGYYFLSLTMDNDKRVIPFLKQ